MPLPKERERGRAPPPLAVAAAHHVAISVFSFRLSDVADVPHVSLVFRCLLLHLLRDAVAVSLASASPFPPLAPPRLGLLTPGMTLYHPLPRTRRRRGATVSIPPPFALAFSISASSRLLHPHCNHRLHRGETHHRHLCHCRHHHHHDHRLQQQQQLSLSEKVPRPPFHFLLGRHWRLLPRPPRLCTFPTLETRRWRTAPAGNHHQHQHQHHHHHQHREGSSWVSSSPPGHHPPGRLSCRKSWSKSRGAGQSRQLHQTTSGSAAVSLVPQPAGGAPRPCSPLPSRRYPLRRRLSRLPVPTPRERT